jgi:hypothetical protein
VTARYCTVKLHLPGHVLRRDTNFRRVLLCVDVPSLCSKKTGIAEAGK